MKLHADFEVNIYIKDETQCIIYRATKFILGREITASIHNPITSLKFKVVMAAEISVD